MSLLRIIIEGPDVDPIDQFISMFYEKTQDHPFDNSARISWDGKAIAQIIPMKAEGYVYLTGMQTLAPGQRTGSPTKLLKTITGISDLTGIPIKIEAKPFGGTKDQLSKKQLIEWYKKNGFTGTGANLTYNPR